MKHHDESGPLKDARKSEKIDKLLERALCEGDVTMQRSWPTNTDLVIDVMRRFKDGLAGNLIGYLRMVHCAKVFYCGLDCRRRARWSYDEGCKECNKNFLKAELCWCGLNREQQVAMVEYVQRQYG